MNLIFQGFNEIKYYSNKWRNEVFIKNFNLKNNILVLPWTHFIKFYPEHFSSKCHNTTHNNHNSKWVIITNKKTRGWHKIIFTQFIFFMREHFIFYLIYICFSCLLYRHTHVICLSKNIIIYRRFWNNNNNNIHNKCTWHTNRSVQKWGYSLNIFKIEIKSVWLNKIIYKTQSTGILLYLSHS